VTCKYHGWGFEPVSGQCREIPSLTKADALDPCRIFATAYPCEKRDGHLWVYVPQSGRGRLTTRPSPTEGLERGTPARNGLERGTPARNGLERGTRVEGQPDFPPAPEVPKFSARFHSAHLTADLPCNIDHGIIGLMDPAHGPFVHRAWWWRSRRSIQQKAKAFAPSPFGFAMTRHAPSRNSRAYRLLGGALETEIVFRLPSMRIEHIRAGRHRVANLTAITPIDARVTEINHCIYWTLPWLGLLKPALRHYVRAFLRQDRDIMERQQQGLRFSPPLTLIDDADTQAKWYYRLKREYLRARAEGRPFENPIQPRTLEWRS
jgi:phenylpropionate dioxygenase-like ring-hydroxylating dioxygenase large terminal subunit